MLDPLPIIARAPVHLSLMPLILLGGLNGCSSPDRTDGGPKGSDAAPSGPAAVTLTTTDYAFAFPDTLDPGWTRIHLVNHGDQPHMGQLIRLDAGRTAEDYLLAYGDAFRKKGPRPEWARRLGGPTVTAPDDSSNATVYLEPGQYIWTCLYNLPDGIPHVFGHGMAKPFVVDSSGEATAAGRTPPEADLVMRLVDYGFSLSIPLRSGRQVIRVENPGTEPHEVGVVRLAPGKSVADFLAWLRNPGAGPEPFEKVFGGVTSIAPGVEAYFEVDLPPGEYLLLCFVTAPDGRSHIEHGMVQQIRVS